MAKSIRRRLSKGKKVQRTEGHLPRRASRSAVSDPKSALLDMQRAAGNQAVSQLLDSGADSLSSSIRNNKIAMSQPGDMHEREAERVAEGITHMSDSVALSSDQPHGRAEKIPVSPGRGRQIQGLNGHGQPLSESDRAFFEPRFGRDLGDVRIHTDASAAELADELDARALTSGKDIVFGAGQHALQTDEGKTLMAHELTHVAQQQNSTSGNSTAGSGGAAIMCSPKLRSSETLTASPSISFTPSPKTSFTKTLELSFTKTPEPVITKNAGGIAAVVYFGQNDFFLDPSHAKVAEEVGEQLAFMYQPTVMVDGHASTEGSDKDNLDLSQHRRQLVLAILESKLMGKAIGKVKFTGEAYGESKLAVPEVASAKEELEEQRAWNRRVEIIVMPYFLPKEDEKGKEGEGEVVPQKAEHKWLLTDPRLIREAEELMKKGNVTDFDMDKAADRVLEGLGIENPTARESIKETIIDIIKEQRPGIIIKGRF